MEERLIRGCIHALSPGRTLRLCPHPELGGVWWGEWDGKWDGGKGVANSCRWMAESFPLAFFPPLFFFFFFFFFSSVLFNQNFKLGSKQLFINLSGEAGISLSGLN